MNIPIDFIVDDFAAAGGWDEGFRRVMERTRKVDIPTIGIEWEANAVATARAAGHPRIHGDVRKETLPRIVRMRHFTGPRFGYIASPPCQTFSAAGNGAGRKHLDSLLHAARLVGDGYTPEDAIKMVSDDTLDERSVLALHPLHVIVTTRPEWALLEQVKEVKPLWEAYATVLSAQGYNVRTEIIKAERYGVPQTRRRAVLVAVKAEHGEAPWPTATHSEFYPRNKAKRDEGVLPFVTMAQALGWGMTERPSMTVCAGGTATGGAEPFGNGARQTMMNELSEGRWMMGDVYRTNGTMREVETEPAATLPAAMDNGNFRFIQVSNYSAPGKPGQTAAERGRGERDVATEPSSTITSKGFNFVVGPVAEVEGDTSWSEERPSPTVVGSFRGDVIAAPGYRKPGDPPRQKTPGSIRVSVEQAAVLQTFPADYPWQGTKNKKHEQIGNAVPPRIGEVFAEVLL